MLVLEQQQGVKYLLGPCSNRSRALILAPALKGARGVSWLWCLREALPAQGRVLGSWGSILPVVTAEVTCWKVCKLWLQLHLSGALREV